MSTRSHAQPVHGPGAPAPTDEDLAEEVRALREEIARIRRSRAFRMHDSAARMLGMQFLRGLAFGLGSVIGATAVVSALVYALSQIDLIPIVGPVIGDWAKEIAKEIRTAP
ncbi:MAG: hypothetical protein D6688_00195 [Alphaproteobacteria bacterium]|nr:MAG: hypothetical protein D6688_00195 [Alphaproteobacteria bacterium]